MARASSLSDPISASNIIARFNSIVTATVNSGISYGTNSKPFPECPSSYFGGDTGGVGDETGGLSGVIDAADLIDKAVAVTSSFTNVRNARFRLRLTATGWYPYNASRGPRGGTNQLPGIIEDVSGKAHLQSSWAAGVGGVDGGDVSSGEAITKSSIQSQLFINCRAAYSLAAASTYDTPVVDVCHSSCHSSCHRSRSRR